MVKYTVAVALARTRGDPLVLAHNVRHLGDAYRRIGRAAKAEPCYLESLSIYRQHKSTKPLDLANALRGYAILKESIGANEEARRLWQEAHDSYVRANVPAGVEESAARLGAIH